MKSSRLILVLSGVMFAVLFSACTRTVNTVERAESRAEPNYVDDERVITDTSLGNKIGVLQVNEDTVSGNIPKIQVVLENKSRRAQNVSYIFEWVDEDGMALSSPTSGWRSLRLMGRESKAVSGVAPNPRAADFTLKLQEAR